MLLGTCSATSMAAAGPAEADTAAAGIVPSGVKNKRALRRAPLCAANKRREARREGPQARLGSGASGLPTQQRTIRAAGLTVCSNHTAIVAIWCAVQLAAATAIWVLSKQLHEQRLHVIGEQAAQRRRVC